MSASAPLPSVLATGFADPVHDAQRTFSALMRAMAEPARPVPLASPLAPPAPLSPEMAAVALTLLDYETPVFLDPVLAAEPAVAHFLRFHTGAPMVSDPAAARFVFITDTGALPDFTAFAQGEPDDPDRSATLVIGVEAMAADIGPGTLQLEGPGIKGRRDFSATPLPADFAARLSANRALYPLGVDLVLCAGGAIAGLPRTVVPVSEG